MTRFIAFFTMAMLLTGCAGPRVSATPEGYTGPKAVLADSVVYPGAGEKIRMFYVEKIDGESMQNSMRATRDASAGKGNYLHTKEFSRDVPVKRMKIRLIGTHVLAMPIQEMASRIAGTFFTVSGEVDFLPLEGKTYVVMGELQKEGASVWIQTQDTKEVVTEKVREKP